MARVILFDLDGTLVNDGPNWRHSVSQALQCVIDAEPHVDAKTLETTYYDVLGAIWEAIRDVPAPPFGNVDAPEILHRVWSDVLSRLDVAGASTVQLAADTYLEHRRQGGTAYDDTVPCLEALRDAGCRLGVITNGLVDTQHAKIRNAGLWYFFEQITTTDTGLGKPDPAIFEHALSELQATSADSVYVGDSLAWDIGGARNAGLAAVWINRKADTRAASDPQPDVEFTSLASLPQWVADGQ